MNRFLIMTHTEPSVPPLVAPRHADDYQSLKHIVCDFILMALKDGRLKHGDRIEQNAICKALGVSRTPVREALLQLEPLGLVSFLPRKRIVVNGLTEENLKDLFETIAPLEAAAARLAIPHLTESDFENFDKSLVQMQALIENRALETLNKELEAFHGIHLARCPNRLMVSTITLLKRRLYYTPQRLVFIPEWERRMFAEHKTLVELFRARDVEGVVRFMQFHWDWEHNEGYALRSYFSSTDAEPTPGGEKGSFAQAPHRG